MHEKGGGQVKIFLAALATVLIGLAGGTCAAAEEEHGDDTQVLRRKLLNEQRKVEAELKKLDLQLEQVTKRQEKLLEAAEAGLDREMIAKRAALLEKQAALIRERRKPLVEQLAAIRAKRNTPEMMTVEERLAALESRMDAGRSGAKTGEGGGGGEVPDGPKWFERIDVAVGITGVLQGSLGAKETYSAEEDVTDASMSFDLELSAPVGENGTVFALLEAGSGEGLDSELPTFWGFNGDADDDANVRLTEAWYEHSFAGGTLTVRIGKVDVGGGCGRNEAAFDSNALANDECGQFLSPGFVNSIAIEAPDDNGFGVMAWWSPHEFVEVGLAVADADADWDNVGDDPFFIAQVDLKPVFGKRKGTYRLYGWFNDKAHALIEDPLEDDRSGHGFGLSADQELTDWLSAFGRYGWQRPDVYEVEHAWSAGFQVSGSLWKRGDDAFGLAYGQALLGEEGEEACEALGGNPNDEHHLELYYNFAVNEGLVITPNAQYAKYPEGDGDADDVWVLGIRAQLSF